MSTMQAWPSCPSTSGRMLRTGRASSLGRKRTRRSEGYSKLVGTGPFILKDYVPGEYVRLVKKPELLAFEQVGPEVSWLHAAPGLGAPGAAIQ